MESTIELPRLKIIVQINRSKTIELYGMIAQEVKEALDK